MNFLDNKLLSFFFVHMFEANCLHPHDLINFGKLATCNFNKSRLSQSNFHFPSNNNNNNQNCVTKSPSKFN